MTSIKDIYSVCLSYFTTEVSLGRHCLHHDWWSLDF